MNPERPPRDGIPRASLYFADSTLGTNWKGSSFEAFDFWMLDMSRISLATIVFWSALTSLTPSAQAASLPPQAEEEIAKAAKSYVDRLVVRCGDSSFLRKGKSIWEFKGSIELGGCHEPPRIANEKSGRTSWSCSVEVHAPKMRASVPNGGWTEWEDPPPLLVGVSVSQDRERWNASVSQGQFAAVACNDVSGKDVQREGKLGTVTANTPGDGFLALRSEPSSQRGVRVLKIPHGSELQLGSCVAAAGGDNWCQTKYQGLSGWILDRYVAASDASTQGRADTETGQATSDLEAIDVYIRDHARREQGVEYGNARQIKLGDLDGDGTPETVVLYTIEGQSGSNTHVQYLAVFAMNGNRLVPVTWTEVGGKSRRSMDLRSVDRKVITFDTISYAPEDPSCCPSIRGTTSYVLNGKALLEQRNAKASSASSGGNAGGGASGSANVAPASNASSPSAQANKVTVTGEVLENSHGNRTGILTLKSKDDEVEILYKIAEGFRLTKGDQVTVVYQEGGGDYDGVLLSAHPVAAVGPGGGGVGSRSLGSAKFGAQLDRKRAAELLKIAYGYPQPDKAVMLKRYLIEYRRIKEWAGGQAVSGVCVGFGAQEWSDVAPIIEKLAAQELVAVGQEKVKGQNCITTFTRLDLTDKGRAYLLAEDDNEYTLRVSEVDLNQVTGIVQQQGSTLAIAEYDLSRRNETPFSAILRLHSGNSLSPLETQRSPLVLYDDGWRVKK